jgi:hypothetical protein
MRAIWSDSGLSDAQASGKEVKAKQAAIKAETKKVRSRP